MVYFWWKSLKQNRLNIKFVFVIIRMLQWLKSSCWYIRCIFITLLLSYYTVASDVKKIDTLYVYVHEKRGHFVGMELRPVGQSGEKYFSKETFFKHFKQVCARGNTLVVVLLCYETVWNKTCANFSFLQIFPKNLLCNSFTYSKVLLYYSLCHTTVFFENVWK